MPSPTLKHTRDGQCCTNRRYVRAKSTRVDCRHPVGTRAASRDGSTTRGMRGGAIASSAARSASPVSHRSRPPSVVQRTRTAKLIPSVLG
jgi:hypothetical protein